MKREKDIKTEEEEEEKKRKEKVWTETQNLFSSDNQGHCLFGCYFESFAFDSTVQVQPLSLEELLAKKKAEEEAEAKVRRGERNGRPHRCSVCFLLISGHSHPPNSLSYFVPRSPSFCPRPSERPRLWNGGSSRRRRGRRWLKRRGRREGCFKKLGEKWWVCISGSSVTNDVLGRPIRIGFGWKSHRIVDLTDEYVKLRFTHYCPSAMNAKGLL